MKSLWAILHEWKQITQQKIRYYFIQLTTATLYVGFQTLPTIFSAITITKITEGDFKAAILWLILGTLSVLVGYIFWEINYRTGSLGHRVTLKNLQNRLYPRIINVEKSDMDKTTKEFIMNTVVNDADTAAMFFDTLATRTCYIIQVLVILSIVISINVWAGLAILALGLIDALLLSWINGKNAKIKKDRYACADKFYEGVISLSEGRNTIKDLNAEKYFKDEFDKKCNSWIRINNSSWHWTSVRDNWFPAFYSLMIALITLCMIILVSKGGLSLTLYLIIVPYLTTCTEKLNSVFNITKDLKEVDVSLNRLKVVMSFNDKELEAFGKTQMTGSETLQFINVSANKVDADTSAVYDLNFSIKYGETVVFKGSKQCGKRTIFRLIRRKLLPSQGKILLDNVPYNEYSTKTFKTNLNYLTGKPYYFPGTIMSNMKVVEKSTKKIYTYCKQLGIYDYILGLPKGFKTELSQDKFPLPADKLFLLGLVRILLTNSKIIILYELPAVLTQVEKENMVQRISTLKGNKTLIIFTHDAVFDSIANKMYEIKNGKILNQR